jgi:hypothetical protein
VAEPELRVAVAQNAWKDVSERYGLDAITGHWLRELERLPTAGRNLPDIRRAQAAVDALDLPGAGQARRVVLLWHFGREHLAQHGLVATMRKTGRFVWRRITGQA